MSRFKRFKILQESVQLDVEQIGPRANLNFIFFKLKYTTQNGQRTSVDRQRS